MAKKKSTAVAEKALEATDVIDVSDIKVDIDEIAKSIDAVDTTIESESNIDEISAKIQEQLKPIQEIEAKVKDIMGGQEDFNEAMAKNPENATAIVMEEIKKAESLKKEVEKIIESTKVEGPIINMTSWWNGMGYDL